MMHRLPSRPLAFLLLVLLFLPVSAQAQRSLGDKIDDLRLSAAVRTVLLEDAQTGPYDLRVRTEDGVVILSGTVPTLGVRLRAGELAAAVPDVQTVRNEINLDDQLMPVTVTGPSEAVAIQFPTDASESEEEEGASETMESPPEPIPTQPAPVDDSEEPVYHRVERGETLFSLARRYETTVGEIQRLNRLGSSTTIEIGQRLRMK